MSLWKEATFVRNLRSAELSMWVVLGKFFAKSFLPVPNSLFCQWLLFGVWMIEVQRNKTHWQSDRLFIYLFDKWGASVVVTTLGRSSLAPPPRHCLVAPQWGGIPSLVLQLSQHHCVSHSDSNGTLELIPLVFNEIAVEKAGGRFHPLLYCILMAAHDFCDFTKVAQFKAK